MNLRELVATLETGGKPEFSEEPVMVRTPSGRIYKLGGVEFAADYLKGFTVWLKVEEA